MPVGIDRAVVFKSGGADSNRLSISLSVLFSETSNSGGAKTPPLTTALFYKPALASDEQLYIVIVLDNLGAEIRFKNIVCVVDNYDMR